jgi:prevent-host-death family protein
VPVTARFKEKAARPDRIFFFEAICRTKCSTLGPMGEVSVRTLNQATSKVLARVKRGEEITLTERGEVIAQIIPVSASPLQTLIGTGRVEPATLHGPAPRATIPMHDAVDAGALLERMRNEERY